MTPSPDIYLDHFGFSERPFSLVPDPEFMFWSKLHARAFAMLEYGILTKSPITLITGDVGAGKTTLVHHLLKSLPENLRIGMISNAHGDRGELLRWVLQALDQTPSDDATYVDLFGQFENFLIAEYAAGRRVILIFDEAQNLSLESLEELRMFTNINSNKDELLQLIIVGQPELRAMINRPGLSQFAQRVASNFHLRALGQDMVEDYIAHRLKVAGVARRIFNSKAIEMIYLATRGVPRLVNQLCDLTLLYAYADGRRFVTGSVVQEVLDDGVYFGGGDATEEDETVVEPTSIQKSRSL